MWNIVILIVLGLASTVMFGPQAALGIVLTTVAVSLLMNVLERR